MAWWSVFGMQRATHATATLVTLCAVCYLLCANPLARALIVPFKKLDNLSRLSSVPAGLIRKRGARGCCGVARVQPQRKALPPGASLMPAMSMSLAP